MATGDKSDIISIEEAPLSAKIPVAGTVVNVPEVPLAKLMFYIHCIANLVDLEDQTDSLSKLRNYNQYYLLDDNDINELIVLCLLLYPGNLSRKILFPDENLCGNHENRYEEVREVRKTQPVPDEISIGGQNKTVYRVMLVRLSFLEKIYFVPMLDFNERLEKIRMSASRVTDSGFCCNVM